MAHIYAKIGMHEDELVLALKSKQESAYRYLYINYSNALYKEIVSIVKDHHISEDILQSTFVKIWAKIGLYDEQKARLYTWMICIARNNSLDFMKSKRALFNSKVCDINIVQSAINPSMETIGIRKSIQKLSPKYRAIVEMVYFNGFSIRETSEYFLLPEGTVKTRLRRSISLLREEFDECL